MSGKRGGLPPWNPSPSSESFNLQYKRTNGKKGTNETPINWSKIPTVSASPNINDETCDPSANLYQLMGTPEGKEHFLKLMNNSYIVIHCAAQDDITADSEDTNDIGNNVYSEENVLKIFNHIVSPLNGDDKNTVLTTLTRTWGENKSIPLDLFVYNAVKTLSGKTPRSKKLARGNTTDATLLRIILVCLLSFNSVEAIWKKYNIWNYIPDFSSINAAKKTIVSYVVPEVFVNPEKTIEKLTTRPVILAEHDEENIADVTGYLSNQLAHVCGVVSGGLWIASGAAAVIPGAQPLVPFLAAPAWITGACSVGSYVTTLGTNVTNIGLRSYGHEYGGKKLPDDLPNFLYNKGLDMATKAAINRAINGMSSKLGRSVKYGLKKMKKVSIYPLTRSNSESHTTITRRYNGARNPPVIRWVPDGKGGVIKEKYIPPAATTVGFTSLERPSEVLGYQETLPRNYSPRINVQQQRKAEGIAAGEIHKKNYPLILEHEAFIKNATTFGTYDPETLVVKGPTRISTETGRNARIRARVLSEEVTPKTPHSVTGLLKSGLVAAASVVGGQGPMSIPTPSPTPTPTQLRVKGGNRKTKKMKKPINRILRNKRRNHSKKQ